MGRVVKAHGVRGELVVEVRTDEPDQRFARGTSLLARLPRGAGERTVTVTAAREHSGRLLLSLDEVNDRSSADALRGTLFVIDSADVDSGDDPDAFYDHELEGVGVRTTDGAEVGIIDSILHLPANDILVVRTPEGREILVPFVREIVPTVTLGGVVIDPPEGLLGEAVEGDDAPDSAADQPE